MERLAVKDGGNHGIGRTGAGALPRHRRRPLFYFSPAQKRWMREQASSSVAFAEA